MEAEIAIFRGNQLVKETTLLEEIQKKQHRRMRSIERIRKKNS